MKKTTSHHSNSSTVNAGFAFSNPGSHVLSALGALSRGLGRSHSMEKGEQMPLTCSPWLRRWMPAVRHSHQFYLPVVIAVIAMGMVKVAIDKIVGAVAVRNRFVAAAGAVFVAFFVGRRSRGSNHGRFF